MEAEEPSERRYFFGTAAADGVLSLSGWAFAQGDRLAELVFGLLHQATAFAR